MHDSIQYQFLGFDPDYNVRCVVSGITEKIHLNAPSDSAIKVILEESTDAIKASCRIVSQAGVFIADTVSDCPVSAIRQVEKKIERQLKRWRKYRFRKKEEKTSAA